MRYRTLVFGAVRWAGVGAVVGVVVSAGLLAFQPAKPATDTSFALGALVLGFGVTAWSSAVGLGRTIEGLQARLDVSSDWTEASAREAFFVLSWTGTGWAVAAALTSVALGV
ncbi:DUF7268 family protein [Halorubrum tebenquichense]|uniref:MFS transporter n=1 Tax=Halorubrum tebenquichense DSM 14210 TaxID=1227485 RepID=M0DNE9_9EURY|nr:hypothetical protein [Halorubrum tebenquichense]ELZ35679.1 hypothetical protein C472_11649 [Halorubrum tebenquichense DSM 14210]